MNGVTLKSAGAGPVIKQQAVVFTDGFPTGYPGYESFPSTPETGKKMMNYATGQYAPVSFDHQFVHINRCAERRFTHKNQVIFIPAVVIVEDYP